MRPGQRHNVNNKYSKRYITIKSTIYSVQSGNVHRVITTLGPRHRVSAIDLRVSMVLSAIGIAGCLIEKAHKLVARQVLMNEVVVGVGVAALRVRHKRRDPVSRQSIRPRSDLVIVDRLPRVSGLSALSTCHAVVDPVPRPSSRFRVDGTPVERSIKRGSGERAARHGVTSTGELEAIRITRLANCDVVRGRGRACVRHLERDVRCRIACEKDMVAVEIL